MPCGKGPVARVYHMYRVTRRGTLGSFPGRAFSNRTAGNIPVWVGLSSRYDLAAVWVDAGVGATAGVRAEVAVASAGGGTGSGWIRGRRGRREESRTASRRCRTGCKVVPFSRGPARGRESFRVGAVGADPGRCVGRVESGVPTSYPLRCAPVPGAVRPERPLRGSHTRGWPCADAAIGRVCMEKKV